jgi:hypothetical protein
MWIYVDESGNTGNRLFDDAQPLFVTAAMMTKTNFDALYNGELKSIAAKMGRTALHFPDVPPAGSFVGTPRRS